MAFDMPKHIAGDRKVIQGSGNAGRAEVLTRDRAGDWEL
jgi:hypothetical protein